MDAYKAITEITSAVNMYGVTGQIVANPVSDDPEESRFEVTLNCAYFGIYDIDRHTFVD